VAEPLRAFGIVFDGDAGCMALCSLDWCEIRNESYRRFVDALARALETAPERVAVQCLHPHNAPFCDHAAQQLIEEKTDLPDLMDVKAFDAAVEGVANAARESLSRLSAVTHVAYGQAEVREVASNRRVLGEDGTVRGIRWSACRDPALRDAPEGVIDPLLRTISFWDGDRKRAALHYYATHPMSYYGDGIVTPDFYGLARNQRADEEGVPHLAFTGCAGDVTAGKYNDGSPASRAALTRRLRDAMAESEENATKEPIREIAWRSGSIPLAPRRDLREDRLLATLEDRSRRETERKSAALKLAFLRRAQNEPVAVSCLSVNDAARILHLPGEPFVEYQLHAQRRSPERFVAVSGYGDCGMGYLPLERSFAEGGYEPTEACAEPSSQSRLENAIAELTG
jgi:hypothetical protein